MWMILVSALAQEAYPTGSAQCANADVTIVLTSWTKQGGNAPAPGLLLSSKTLTITKPGESHTFTAETRDGSPAVAMPVTIEVLNASKPKFPNPGPYGQVTHTERVRLTRTAGGDLLPNTKELEVRWTCAYGLAAPIPMAQPIPIAPR